MFSTFLAAMLLAASLFGGMVNATPVAGELSSPAAFAFDNEDDWGLPALTAVDIVTGLETRVFESGLVLTLDQDLWSDLERRASPAFAAALDGSGGTGDESITLEWWSGNIKITLRLTPKGSEKPGEFAKRLGDTLDTLQKFLPDTGPPSGGGQGSGGGGSGGGAAGSLGG